MLSVGFGPAFTKAQPLREFPYWKPKPSLGEAFTLPAPVREVREGYGDAGAGSPSLALAQPSPGEGFTWGGCWVCCSAKAKQCQAEAMP